jgi:glycosyltransferase involved in cell wall biosynthesis
VNPGKVRVILNGYDFDPGKLGREPAEPMDCRRLHIHYSGTIQHHCPIPVLFDALRRLKRQANSLDDLPVVTFTGLGERVRASIRDAGIEDVVRDVGIMPHLPSIEYCRRSDVLIVMVKNDPPGSQGTIPAKIYEAMALGIHVLGILPLGSDAAKLLAAYGNATICDADDADDVQRAFVELRKQFVEHNGRMPVLPAADREAASAAYSRARQAGQLMELIESMANSSRNAA